MVTVPAHGILVRAADGLEVALVLIGLSAAIVALVMLVAWLLWPPPL